MNNNQQIQITLSGEAMDALKAAAGKKGITPNILARLILHEQFDQKNAESKSYTFTAKDWREIEAYVDAKRLGSVEVFAAFSMAQYMARFALTKGQKQQVDKNIGNAV